MDLVTKRFNCASLKCLLILPLLVLSSQGYAQDLNIFDIQPGGFVSLSDVDVWKGIDHSTILPVLQGREQGTGYAEKGYLQISGKYRYNFLSRTNINESDTMFIYSYSKKLLLRIPISDLTALAILSPYIDSDNCPCSISYYQFGFVIDSSSVVNLEESYTNTFVYIGKLNPFLEDKLQQITWTDISYKEYPSHLITEEVNFNFGNNDFAFTTGACYKFQSHGLIYYIQKLMKDDYQFGLRLIVINQKTKDKKLEQLFFGGESASFASLKSQWTGNLFKDKPPVIFGFQSHSFGCPAIHFLDSEHKGITINCDNRH